MRTKGRLIRGSARPGAARLARSARRRMGWLGAVVALGCGDAGSGDDGAVPGRKLTPGELGGMGAGGTAGGGLPGAGGEAMSGSGGMSSGGAATDPWAAGGAPIPQSGGAPDPGTAGLPPSAGGAAPDPVGAGGAPPDPVGAGGAPPDPVGAGGAPPVTGGAGCPVAGATICQDFESTAVGATPAGWTARGNASVTEAFAAHGSRSLAIGQTWNGERRIVTSAASLGSAHWGRVYYKVQLPVPGAFVHSTIVALQGQGPTRGNSEYRVVDTVKQTDGRHQFLYNVQPMAPGFFVNNTEFGTGSPYDYRFDDAWHCAEWMIDGPMQAYRYFIDGVEVTSIAKSNGAGNYPGTDIPNSFSDLKVGWNNYQSASPGFVAWVDDLAAGPTRIGCVAP